MGLGITPGPPSIETPNNFNPGPDGFHSRGGGLQSRGLGLKYKLRPMDETLHDRE